jgi:hypothetical protein
MLSSKRLGTLSLLFPGTMPLSLLSLFALTLALPYSTVDGFYQIHYFLPQRYRSGSLPVLVIRVGKVGRTAVFSFPIQEENDDGPSYSDGFLLGFHNQGQDEMQLETNSLAVWNEQLQEEQLSVKEWQDSFQRNGLADFTPPMSLGLNCLMVGGEDFGGENTKLPWEDEAEATVTPLRITAESTQVTDPAESGDGAIIIKATPALENENPSTIIKTEAVGRDTATSLSVKDPNKAAAAYDCIVDQGLLEAVLALSDDNAVQELILEAATAIREHGIYVFVSRAPLLPQTKALLEECSILAGLEWHFELDGISNMEQSSEVVSVARRFCNGAMPRVGRLSRFQP